MRLPGDSFKRIFALSLVSFLAACGGGDGSGSRIASAGSAALNDDKFGPEADYPMVLGKTYTVDGQSYTPSASLNHDEIGYATFDQSSGIGITASHKTLPLPSYAEVTALDTGKTILVRVERRGPMTSSRAVGLSEGALAQLGITSDGMPVRIRRVNPPEIDRAMLRKGDTASKRMNIPKNLLAVLRRNLPSKGSANLSRPRPASVSQTVRSAAQTNEAANPAARNAVAQNSSFSSAFSQSSGNSTPQAEPFRALNQVNSARSAVLNGNPSLVPQPAQGNSEAITAATKARSPIPSRSGADAFFRKNRRVASTARQAPTPVAAPAPAPAIARVEQPAAPSRSQARRSFSGGFVIQAAAYSNEANARRAAKRIGGFIERSGRIYRVRVGPFSNRGQADAALAKVHREGYRDARVFTAR